MSTEWNKEPTLKEFAKTFNEYVDEVGVMANKEGFIGSHNIIGYIDVRCENDDDAYYEITGLDMEQLAGCGCWSGIRIRIRKVDNEQT